MIFNILGVDKNYIEGAKELGALCGFTINDGGFVIFAKKIDEGLRVEFDDANFRLFYSSKIDFYLGLSYCVQHFGRNKGVLVRDTNLSLGLMKICVGNATLRIDTIKNLIKIMALLGYKSLVYSVEDLFDVDNLPYLGSFKYKITKEYIKEIDEYAKIFGIELIPGIQTLCPMNALRSRDAFVDIMAYFDTLLVKNEKTYAFIEQLIKFCAETFSSNKIHLGMESTKNIRLGAYFKQNGYVKDIGEIFVKHVKRVNEIAQKHFLSPLIWADNLFYGFLDVDSKNAYQNIDTKEFDKKSNFDLSKTIQWGIRAYPKYSQKNFEKAVETISEIIDNKYTAVDLYTGMGFSPLNKKAQDVAENVIKINKKRKLNNLTCIISDENGAECSCFSALPSLVRISEDFYGGSIEEKDISDRMESLFNVNFSIFNLLDISYKIPFKNLGAIANPCKYLFYNDTILGIFDYYVFDGAGDIFQHCAKLLKEYDFSRTRFEYLFDTAITLYEFLSKKSNLGIEIKKFYLQKNHKELKRIANKTIPDTIVVLDKFYKLFKEQWHKENYSIGFEIIDVRIGGLKERLVQTSKTLKSYLKGNIKAIPELEQERLPYLVNNEKELDIFFNSYREIASGSDI